MMGRKFKHKNIAFLFLLMSFVCFSKTTLSNPEIFINPLRHNPLMVEADDIEEHYTFHMYSPRSTARRPEGKSDKADL